MRGKAGVLGANLEKAWTMDHYSWLFSYSVASQELDPLGVFFKYDGLAMYVVGADSDTVLEYSLSVAWDVSTATYLRGISVAEQNAYASGIFMSPSGGRMYLADMSYDRIAEYGLSEAWNVSTATHVRNLDVSARDNNPADVFFSDDGTHMYFIGLQNDSIYQYLLSSPWNISTATFVQSKSVNAEDTSPTGLFFAPAGKRLFVAGGGEQSIHQYDLSVAWDVSTATYYGGFSVFEASSPFGIFFGKDGRALYVTGRTYSEVTQYDLSHV